MTFLLVMTALASAFLLLAWVIEAIARQRPAEPPDTSRGLLPRDHYR